MQVGKTTLIHRENVQIILSNGVFTNRQNTSLDFVHRLFPLTENLNVNATHGIDTSDQIECDLPLKILN